MPHQSPMYQQIADDLRGQIKAGLLAPGIQLPTELELRDRYSASRNTVRDAIKRLIGQGLVQARPGQGTFVAVRFKPFVTVLSTDPRVSHGGGGEGANYPLTGPEQVRKVGVRNDPEIRVLPCPPEVARLLQLQGSDKVVSRHEQRLINDDVWSLQTSYYPLEWVTRGATRLLIPENIPEGTIRYLGDTLDLIRTGYLDKVTARLPTARPACPPARSRASSACPTAASCSKSSASPSPMTAHRCWSPRPFAPPTGTTWSTNTVPYRNPDSTRTWF
jgi:GntR family transcriptional regulator